MMSYMDFTVQMGLVDVVYTRTTSYSEHHVDLLVHMILDQVLTQTLQGHKAYIYKTIKVSSLGRSAFYYLNAILLRALAGRGDSTRVVNLQDLFFLWIMVAREPIHIGHALTCQLRHQ